MMNREYMKQTYADNLTAWREYRAQIAQDAETLCEIVQNHRFNGGTPEQAAREIVQAIGAENAHVIIASAVNAHEGDGRLSAAVIEWAQGIGWDCEMSCNLGLTLDSKMHMCHINQTAEALMNLPEDEPEQPETEHAEADETETENNEEEETMMNELKKYVYGIRDELKALYELDITDEEREKREESGDPCSLYDYFDDVLDIEYTIDSHGEYLGARVYVTLGGPNVWIDTCEGYVKGAWGTDREESWIPPEINDEINDIFREYYDCIRG